MTKGDHMNEAIDYGTPTKQRLAKGVWASVPTDVPGSFARQDLIECVIQRYHHRMQINDRQAAAGLGLRRVWRAGVLEPATIGGYGANRGGGGGATAPSEARFYLRKTLVDSGLAKARHDAPPIVLSCRKGELKFPEIAGLILTPTGHVAVGVCGLDEWAGGTQRLMMLRDALTALADMWGYEVN